MKLNVKKKEYLAERLHQFEAFLTGQFFYKQAIPPLAQNRTSPLPPSPKPTATHATHATQLSRRHPPCYPCYPCYPAPAATPHATHATHATCYPAFPPRPKLPMLPSSPAATQTTHATHATRLPRLPNQQGSWGGAEVELRGLAEHRAAWAGGQFPGPRAVWKRAREPDEHQRSLGGPAAGHQPAGGAGRFGQMSISEPDEPRVSPA